MIVMKFGGTSVGDAACIGRAVEIVGRERARRPLVVVSAIAGATRTLVRIGQTAGAGDAGSALELLADLVRRHHRILHDLSLAEPEERDLSEAITRHAVELEDLARGVALVGELTPRSQDAIMSYGERLSNLLLVGAARRQGLDAALLDAAEVMITDDRFGRARPDRAELARRAAAAIAPLLAAGRLPVIPGFIGATRDGVPTTMGFEASDYSASLLGAALSADEIQIWTDVDGVLTADNRVVPDALCLRELSYGEAAEAAYFGAKVLHPRTIEPAVDGRIPIRILNSRRPTSRGTTIRAGAEHTAATVKSIAAKPGIEVLRIGCTQGVSSYRFLREVFEVFGRHELAIDLVTVSQASLAVAVTPAPGLDAVVQEIGGLARVTVERPCAIVCLVGHRISEVPGLLSRALESLEGMDLRMLGLGASGQSLPLVVRGDASEEAVRRLHRAFFDGAALPEIFEPVAAGAGP